VFTCTGVKLDPARLGGPPTLRIQGALHHLVGSLLPQPNAKAAFLQLYLFNNLHNQEEHRGKAFANRNRPISTEIAELLSRTNPFAFLLINAGEQIRSDPSTDVHISLKAPDASDKHRYHKPLDESIAAIIPAAEEGAIHRDIVITYWSGVLARIYETSPYYLPLRNPLRFPYDECGWHIIIPRHGFSTQHLARDTQRATADRRG